MIALVQYFFFLYSLFLMENTRKFSLPVGNNRAQEAIVQGRNSKHSQKTKIIHISHWYFTGKKPLINHIVHWLWWFFTKYLYDCSHGKRFSCDVFFIIRHTTPRRRHDNIWFFSGQCESLLCWAQACQPMHKYEASLPPEYQPNGKRHDSFTFVHLAPLVGE